MTKMTTEEAFVKVLQMHGIEHAYGIIGSAMMPVSDLFPKAGITFWDCAHECNAGMMSDGYSRASGKMSMCIAQNGPGITNFVTPIKTGGSGGTSTSPRQPAVRARSRAHEICQFQVHGLPSWHLKEWFPTWLGCRRDGLTPKHM